MRCVWQDIRLLRLQQLLSDCLPDPTPLSPNPNPTLDNQVTMTDLPEALPILRHNTEATFGTLRDNDGSLSQDRHKADGAAVGKCEACRRPTIRQLSWGDEVEAEEVAAAAAAKCAEEGETEWQGFDLIVVRDMGGRNGRRGEYGGSSWYKWRANLKLPGTIPITVRNGSTCRMNLTKARS